MGLREAARFLATVAEDGVVDDLIFQQPFAGMRNIARWFETWKAAVPGTCSEITAILGLADFVLVESTLHGSLKAHSAGWRHRRSPSRCTVRRSSR